MTSTRGGGVLDGLLGNNLLLISLYFSISSSSSVAERDVLLNSFVKVDFFVGNI